MRIILITIVLFTLHFRLLAQSEPTLDAAPNPFIDTTSVTFTLSTNDTVSLVVYDQMGVLIDSLIKEQLMSAGTQSIQFVGDTLPNGQYFAFLDVDTHLVSKKLVKVQCAVSSISWTNSIWCLPCNGQVITAAIGTPPFSYSWSTGDSTSSVDSLCAGSYALTMTDSTGCIATDSVTLTQEPAMTVSISTTPATCPTCSDGSMTIIPSDGCGTPYTINTIPWDPWFMPSQVFPGTYVIEVCDNCGCCVQDTVTVDTLLVSITEVKLQSLEIYPNPTTGQITVTGLAKEASRITVYNALGELVHEGAGEPVIDLSAFLNGVYFILANDNDRVHTTKIIKL